MTQEIQQGEFGINMVLLKMKSLWILWRWWALKKVFPFKHGPVFYDKLLLKRAMLGIYQKISGEEAALYGLNWS